MSNHVTGIAYLFLAAAFSLVAELPISNARTDSYRLIAIVSGVVGLVFLGRAFCCYAGISFVSVRKKLTSLLAVARSAPSSRKMEEQDSTPKVV